VLAKWSTVQVGDCFTQYNLANDDLMVLVSVDSYGYSSVFAIFPALTILLSNDRDARFRVEPTLLFLSVS
jgi:hypothetical protein